MDVVWWLIVGLVAGALARLLVPGRDPIGFLGTIVLGLAGSLVGGFLADLISEEEGFSTAGLIGSIVGAVIVLLVWRAVVGRRRSRVTP